MLVLKKSKRLIIAYMIATIVLAVNYYYNPLRVISYSDFNSTDLRDESMVVGRLALSETNGIAQNHAFNGSFVNHDFAYNSSLYFENEPLNTSDYIVYYSQPGGQSLFYTLLTKALPINNQIKWQVIKWFNAVFIAAIFVWLIAGLVRVYNPFTGIFFYLFCLVAPVLITFAKSPWWCLWSFYLPFVILFTKAFSEQNFKLTGLKVYSLVFGLFLLKYILTGFEFVIPFLVALIIPFVYVAFRQGIGLQIRFVVGLTVTLLLSVVVSLSLLTAQISLEKKSITKSMEYIMYSFAKRSNTTLRPEIQIEEVYQVSLKSSVVSVINKYLSRPVFKFQSKGLPFLNYYNLLVLNILMGAFMYFRKQKTELFFTGLIAFLGCLTWFVVFKGHATIHGHLDEMALYLPWVLLAVMNVGYFISMNYKLFLFKQE